MLGVAPWKGRVREGFKKLVAVSLVLKEQGVPTRWERGGCGRLQEQNVWRTGHVSGTLGLWIVCFKGTHVAGAGVGFPEARINYKGFIDPLQEWVRHCTPWHNGKQ